MEKVLIAEDEITSRVVIAKAVERMGLIGINSPNGIHAWQTLEANPDIALLITDARMPEMDGRDLIRRIRAQEDICKMPIIIMSGVVGPKAIAELLEQGATWFLAKPVNTRELQSYIKQSLGK